MPKGAGDMVIPRAWVRSVRYRTGVAGAFAERAKRSKGKRE
jgi:creatinine amidohydrolase/Fe(II)-dependent formamide hydrolase-like protein